MGITLQETDDCVYGDEVSLQIGLPSNVGLFPKAKVPA
jgi:hypothetical protein